MWAGQRSITANIWSLNTYIYVMVIVTSGFSKKSFFLLKLLLFPNSFEQS